MGVYQAFYPCLGVLQWSSFIRSRFTWAASKVVVVCHFLRHHLVIVGVTVSACRILLGAASKQYKDSQIVWFGGLTMAMVCSSSLDKIQASILPSVAVPLQVTIGKQSMCGGRILSRSGARTGGPQTAYRTLIWLL